ncbi:MAG: hypothetical protein MI919_06730, partial [Holophagales bacterium]|nr:hypothetical protein [Holophagales bacterium]
MRTNSEPFPCSKPPCFSRLQGARRVSCLLLGLALLPLGAVWSPPAGAEDGDLDGRFRLGYRFVDTSGNENKYREDLNLDEGARLFELRLDFEAPDSMRSLVDRASLDVQTFGGDPFETLHLRVQRFGTFDFRFDRTESTYFYEDIIVPKELADFNISDGGDFHHFDFDRVRDRASLKVKITPAAEILVGLDRFTKKGESTTTLDVSRDEFELDQPVDESYDQLRVGLRYSWPKATLVL